MSAAQFVLLVDDIPDHMYVYEVALRARGYRVTLADTGGEAIALARKDRPDCLVIDERLSDVRGWDLCREFKSDPLLAHIPIVMLAQDLTTEAAAEGKLVGCDSWLARPAVPDDLVRAVEEVLAKGTSAPDGPDDAMLGVSTCAACDSARIRAGVRVGLAQYFRCRDCGFRWRIEATDAATA
jgi:two-component system, cell cycle response regulator DivK